MGTTFRSLDSCSTTVCVDAYSHKAMGGGSFAAAIHRPVEAVAQVEAWTAARSDHLLHPGPAHFTHLQRVLEHAGAAGDLTNDAPLASLGLEHKANPGQT